MAKSVLVVDDEEILRDAIASMLRRAGYEARTAANGASALSILNEGGVDIVISDLQMPVMNGVELITELKKRDAGLPIIVFITAFADLTPERAFDLGAAAVMPKPFGRKEILALVENIACDRLPNWLDALPEGHVPLLPEVEVNESDLGVGGVRVRLASADDLRMDQPVRLRLKAHLGGAQVPLEGAGLVRWTKLGPEGEVHVGLEFVYMPDESRAVFEAWAKAARPVPFIPRCPV